MCIKQRLDFTNSFAVSPAFPPPGHIPYAGRILFDLSPHKQSGAISARPGPAGLCSIEAWFLLKSKWIIFPVLRLSGCSQGVNDFTWSSMQSEGTIIPSLPRCILSTVPNSGKPSTTASYSIYSKLIWSWSHCQDLSSLKLFPNRMKIKTNTEKFFFPKACIYHAFFQIPHCCCWDPGSFSCQLQWLIGRADSWAFI